MDMNNDKIQLSIIEKVKNALNINIDIDDILLFKQLSKAIINNHPDKFTKEEHKKQAEERFIQLNKLKEEFEFYLEEKRLNYQITPYNKQDDEIIEYIKLSADKELEIIRLYSEISKKTKEIDCLNEELNDCRKELRNCQDKYDERLLENVNYSRESISSLYKPPIIGNIIGTTTSIASLSLLLPQVTNILNSIEINIFYSSLILISVSVLWLITHLRRIAAVKLSNNIISNIFSNPNINDLFNIKHLFDDYNHAYFTENDIYNIINDQMSNYWMKIIFFGNFKKLKRDIVENIILELEYKKLIVGTRNNGLEKDFLIECIGYTRRRYNNKNTNSIDNAEPF